MAVAHSAASESHTGTTGSTNQAAFSWTHTQTGTPQGVVVFVSTFVSTANLITSVTYGGVALTRLTGGSALDSAGEQGRMDAFFLGSGLSAGNQTITVNRTNNATVMYAAAATVTAGADTAVPATIVLLQGDGTLTVQSVNDTSPGQNSVRYAGAYSGLNAPPAAGTGSTLLNSIDIGNYGSALVRETTAGQGARNVGFNAATDDRAVVHLAIRELVPRTETPIVGAFTLTGNDATLTVAGGLNNYNLPVDAGTYALVGQPATTRHNVRIGGGTGSFALTGQPATTRHNVRITAETGAFSLTGNPATFTKATPKAIAADRGQFTLTGNPATLRQNYAITTETGAFTVAGQPATLRHNPKIEAATGTFALTGGAPALLRGRYLSGGSGTFIETGQPATFRRTWAIRPAPGAFALTGNSAALTEIGAYEIDPIVGSFTLTGQSAQLAQSQTLPVDAGTFALTGNAAGTRHNVRIDGGTGSFSLTGSGANTRHNQRINAATGTFALNGGSPTVAHSYSLIGGTGTFSLTGNAAALAKTSALGLAATTGTFAITGNAASLVEVDVSELMADAGTFALTGANASLAKSGTTRRRNVLIF
jgi:hypothetical protein